ncbi:MAG: Ig-like domain-containing protein, partial [Gemmatimonadota bacterium]|nr:Ig-like domain-containing protein [Gemmatimonadota bacterium]
MVPGSSGLGRCAEFARRALLPGLVLVAAAACADYVLGPQPPGREPRAVRLSVVQVIIDDGQTSQLAATVLDQQGLPFDAVPDGITLSWTSSDETVVTVDATGLVTGAAPGTAQVTVTAAGGGGLEASVAAGVIVQPVPTAIVVAGGDGQAGTVGDPLADSLRVQVRDRLGNGVPGVAVDFAVSAGGGVLSAAADTTGPTGEAAVRYTLGTVTGPNTVAATTTRLPQTSATFTATGQAGAVNGLRSLTGDAQAGDPGTVLPAPLVALVTDRFDNGVAGVTVNWQVTAGGGTVDAPASVTDAAGQAAVSWTLGAAGQPQTVRADVAGLLTTTFSATAQSAVASVDVTPATATLTAGSTQQFTATPRDAGGNPLTGRTVTWNTSDGTVATIDGTGLLAAVAPGTATVTATVEGVNGAASVTVSAVPVASVDVTPPTATIASGTTQQYTATPRDAGGNPLTGRTVTWGSSNTAVATVDGAGLVQGALIGTATITATAEGVDGTATVTVTVGAPSQLAFTVQPSNALIGQVITPAVEVAVRDAAGNVVPTLADPITVAIGNNPGGATLGGTTDIVVVGGVATFADLSLDATGTGYTLVASAPGLTGATSAAFAVTATAGGTVAWINPAGGSWNVGANWSTGTVPSPADTAVIDLAGTYTVTEVDAVVTVGRLVVGDQGSSGEQMTLAV